MVASDLPLDPGTPLWIALPDLGEVPARVTRIVDGGYACSFIIPLAEPPRSTRAFVTTIELSGHSGGEPGLGAAPTKRWPLLVRLLFALALAAGLWALILSWL